MHKSNKKLKLKTLNKKITLPFIPVRDMMILPFNTAFFFVGRPKSISALKKALATDTLIFLVLQKNPAEKNPKESDLMNIGVVGKILETDDIQSNYKVKFESLTTAKILRYPSFAKEPVVEIEITNLTENKADKEYIEHISPLIIDEFKKYLTHAGTPAKLLIDVKKIPADFCYSIINILEIPSKEKQKVLEITTIKDLLDYTYSVLSKYNKTQKIVSNIREKINKQISRNHREQILSEQMRMIQKELGQTETDEYNLSLFKKLKNSGMHKDAMETVKKEIAKLKQMPPTSAEANLVKNYIECLLDLPWKTKTKNNVNMNDVKKILDEDHYGLTKIKEHILDFIGVSARIGEIKAPIMCFNGPPGVGKTSLAKSIAKALNKNFVRISVGGLRDEAEIKGHRKTYIGAMPGKIIKAMKKANSINPLILIDEVDKMSSSNMGDPAAALLEALDKEQNDRFHDHYLEVEYDLSKVMFICTANEVYKIPHALRDRMEVINLTGYSETEKRHIFLHSMLPKQIKEVGLQKYKISCNKDAINELIQKYTQESGVRQLERSIGKVLRGINRYLLEYKNLKKILITKDTVKKYLGTPRLDWDKVEKDPQIGVVNAMSWSVVGGDLLVIETLIVDKGRGRLIITGQLGNVMKESAQAALSFIKANAALLGINIDKIKDKDFHIHATEAAISKDGPSAGSAFTLGLVSALTKTPIRNDIAITGEITLRGRVLPIGGLKEKLLAAARHNIKEVFIPAENLLQIKEFEKDVKIDLKKIKITGIKDIFTLMNNALAPDFSQKLKKPDLDQDIGKKDDGLDQVIKESISF